MTRSRSRDETPASAPAGDTRFRAVVESIQPCVDGGRYPVKRVVGDEVVVEADCFCDGHDRLQALLLHRKAGESSWSETPMLALDNDRWRGAFRVDALGRYEYTVLAWVDPFLSWRREFEHREDSADILQALATGGVLLREAAGRARGAERRKLADVAERIAATQDPAAGREIALDPALAALAARHTSREFATLHAPPLQLIVEPQLARFSAWYEFFPRSQGADGRHGTFKDAGRMLEYAADLGFDIVYLPPIHPIGDSRRKGPNNTLEAAPGDPGSPWAIGGASGGHKAIAKELGSITEFDRFVKKARSLGLELALDIAFQCSPDHPYVGEHPEWFRKRPDGSIQFAENPPKKYQDIYPFDFECADWKALRDELVSVVRFWLDHGVHVFRVDNPHTKPFALWEHLIAEVKAAHPETLFLSEAFTRPRVMQRLAKIGFSQSYTYFTWRNTKAELEAYFTELTQPPLREYFRPNAWPNTPDILPEFLQHGGRPASAARFVLAATLSSSYGIYGPTFELFDVRPREPGSEEYLDSEKYQLRRWDTNRGDSLAPLVRRVNRIRRENPALQSNDSLRFFHIDNDMLIAYGKNSPAGDNPLVTIVSLDPHHRQSGWIELPLDEFGIDPQQPFLAEDLLGGGTFQWQGSRNYVELDPNGAAAHILRIRRRLRREQDFDYFL
jgi:starch synthase (maltosyl-transferring)